MSYPEGDMAETQGTSEGAAQQEDPKVAILRDALEKEFMAAIPPHLRNDTELSSNLLTLAHQLAEEQAVQEREKAELEKLAVLDSLIPNFFKHSYFLELLGQEVVASARKTTPDSALIVLDLDNFRTFNTRFGHPAGDRLLKSAGKIMLESLRSGDDPGRVGGENWLQLYTELPLMVLLLLQEDYKPLSFRPLKKNLVHKDGLRQSAQGSV